MQAVASAEMLAGEEVIPLWSVAYQVCSCICFRPAYVSEVTTVRLSKPSQRWVYRVHQYVSTILNRKEALNYCDAGCF